MIPLVAPLYDTDDEDAVASAAARRTMGSGEVVASFERAVAERHGMAGGIATSSGTAALELALATLGAGDGDEVIFPSYTCVALLNATRAVRARERLVDNEAEPAGMRFNLDVDLAAAAANATTKAVIVPHAFGVPADVSRLVDAGTPLIEDVALSLGASIDGRPVGSRGDLTVISFHSTKVISTGEGGMLLARESAALERARDLNDVIAAQVRERTAGPDDVRGTYRRRFNFRMTDLSAALGLSQLRRLDSFIARRREIGDRYTEAFADLPVILPAAIARGAFYFRYMVDISPSGRSVADVLSGMAQRGIEVGRGVYPAVHQLLGSVGWGTTRAERCTERMVSVPVHPSLSKDDVRRVIDAFRSELVRRSAR